MIPDKTGSIKLRLERYGIDERAMKRIRLNKGLYCFHKYGDVGAALFYACMADYYLRITNYSYAEYWINKTIDETRENNSGELNNELFMWACDMISSL